jgi:hypothetical protein
MASNILCEQLATERRKGGRAAAREEVTEGGRTRMGEMGLGDDADVWRVISRNISRVMS